jgi:hypothetical protein
VLQKSETGNKGRIIARRPPSLCLACVQFLIFVFPLNYLTIPLLESSTVGNGVRQIRPPSVNADHAV